MHLKCKSERVLKTTKTKKLNTFPSALELKNALQAQTNTPIRNTISELFDENTFVETSTYAKRSFNDFALVDKDNEFEGVITGYGSINGQLVFIFAQDETRMKGAMDENQAKKILALYDLALRKQAPVIGVFASAGADIYEGVTSLSSYGKILKMVTDASSEITQVAYVLGNCTGMVASIASLFDFVVKNENSNFYIVNPELGGAKLDASSYAFAGNGTDCVSFIQSVLNFVTDEDSSLDDDLNRRLTSDTFDGNIANTLTEIADASDVTELFPDFAPGVKTVFASVGTVKCGIVATDFAVNEGKITSDVANKISNFLDLCDSYGLPVVNLVDSNGLCTGVGLEALKNLSLSYTTFDSPMLTVIVGHAIGAAYTLLGSKSVNADLVYSLDQAEIGVLPAKTSVAFAWNDEISTEVSREELETKWKQNYSSPAAAASTGDIDDIIPYSELRARIASGLLMLTC